MYKPLGEFPSRLYRAFLKPEYLDDFLSHGRFRLNNLLYYRKIEDLTRRDITEGRVSYRYPADVTRVYFVPDSDGTYETQEQGLRDVTAEVGNPKYLLCTSLPTIDVDWMKREFTEWIAEISAPIDLAKDLCSYFENSPFRLVGGIEGCWVHYTKGDTFPELLDSVEQARLSYSQKPNCYADEHEFRYVAMLFWSDRALVPPEHIDVNLNKRLPYVTKV